MSFKSSFVFTFNKLRKTISRNPKLASELKAMYYALPTPVRAWLDIGDAVTSVELVLKPLIRKGQDFYFIKIGANDGVWADPTRFFVKKYGWSRIMVEPVQYIFDRLLKNYRDCKNLRFENAAIAETDGFKEFFYIKEKQPSEDILGWNNGLNSFRLDVVLKHKASFPDLEDCLVSEEVRCLTFSSLIKKYSVAKLDLLHIDTEGYDYEILKSIDFSEITPSIILYENAHLEEGNKRESEQLLTSKGYKLIDMQGDTLAYQDLG